MRTTFAGLVCGYLVKFAIPSTNIILLKFNKIFGDQGYFFPFCSRENQDQAMEAGFKPKPTDSQTPIQSSMLPVRTLPQRIFTCSRETYLPPNLQLPDPLMGQKVIFSTSMTQIPLCIRTSEV